MSGSAGGNRIIRSSVAKTAEDYINKVLSKFPGFKGAKISGSYNTGSKNDFGDLDLIVNLTATDKKSIKVELAKYLSSLPDSVIVPFKSDKYKGKKHLNTGEIITILYPITGQPGEYVQIDNMVSISDEEAEFKKEFLDYPAEIQGLMLGLSKVICLEEDPKNIFARLGIKNVPALEPNQEYEFNLSSAGLTLRIVTLDNFKEVERTEVWKSSNWSSIKKLFIRYNIDGSFEDLLNDITSKVKNIRSKTRIKGIFNSMVSIKSGEVNTPKGDNKQQALDKVNSTLSENNLGRYLASMLLEQEETQPTIAIFPGAFKPPHKGHFDVVEQLLKVSDQVVVLVSPKTRDGITADESMAVWNLYKAKLDGSVEVRVSAITPIKETYDVVADNPDTEFRVAFGKGEIDRYKTIEKYPNVKIFDAGEVEGVSATGLRAAIVSKNEEKIKEYLPEGITIEEFMSALNKPVETPTAPPAEPSPAEPAPAVPEQPLQESPPLEFEQDDYQDYTLQNRNKIEKAAYFFNLPISDIEYAFNAGKEVVLSDDMWSKLENSKSYKMKTLDDAIQHALKLGINPKPYIDFIKGGKEMPLPLVLCYAQDKYYLVGGEIVLSLYRALGSIPTVIQGTLNLKINASSYPVVVNEGLIKEYSESLIKKLIQKYKLEQPDLSDEDIRAEILEFDKIKDKLDPNKRDITKYNWNDLQSTIQDNKSTRIKAGKIDKNDIGGDINLVYNKDSITIYKADSKKACIKYGNGYSFCISARGSGNAFDTYRFGDEDEEQEPGLPYFVFDSNRSSAKENGKFIDPAHLLVIFALDYGGYTVTEANNDGEDWFETFDKLVSKYSYLNGLENIIKYEDPSKKVNLGREFTRYVDNKATELITIWLNKNKDFYRKESAFAPNFNNLPNKSKQFIQDILDGKRVMYSITNKSPSGNGTSIITTSPEEAQKELEKYIKKSDDNFKSNISSSLPIEKQKELLNYYRKYPFQLVQIPMNQSTIEYLEGLVRLADVNINNVTQYKESWPVKSIGLAENQETSNKKVDSSIIKEFIKFAIRKLQINKIPEGLTLSYNNDEAKSRHSFGTFDPNNGKIWLYVKNRNMADILRTLAHELVHRKQDEDGRIDYSSGETGSEIENEANAQAGILLRDFGKQNEKIYQ
jgi:cytidyltransferase-like protein